MLHTRTHARSQTRTNARQYPHALTHLGKRCNVDAQFSYLHDLLPCSRLAPKCNLSLPHFTSISIHLLFQLCKLLLSPVNMTTSMIFQMWNVRHWVSRSGQEDHSIVNNVVSRSETSRTSSALTCPNRAHLRKRQVRPAHRPEW